MDPTTAEYLQLWGIGSVTAVLCGLLGRVLADVIRTRISEWRYGYLEAYSEADLRAARLTEAGHVRRLRSSGTDMLVGAHVRKMRAYDLEMARRGINPFESEVLPSPVVSPNDRRLALGFRDATDLELYNTPIEDRGRVVREGVLDTKYGIAYLPTGTVVPAPMKRTVRDVWDAMSAEQKQVAMYVNGADKIDH